MNFIKFMKKAKCLTQIICILFSAAISLSAHAAESGKSPANAEASTKNKAVKQAPLVTMRGVNFISPKAGAKVSNPFKVVFSVEGMKVMPAGPLKPGTGHHHLLIDQGPIAKGTVVPKNETHLHFGKGQKNTKLKLKPGKHTLTLQFADGAHQSYGPDYSKTISIEVKSR